VPVWAEISVPGADLTATVESAGTDHGATEPDSKPPLSNGDVAQTVEVGLGASVVVDGSVVAVDVVSFADVMNVVVGVRAVELATDVVNASDEDRAVVSAAGTDDDGIAVVSAAGTDDDGIAVLLVSIDDELAAEEAAAGIVELAAAGLVATAEDSCTVLLAAPEGDGVCVADAEEGAARL
jgi:hypothetical protein